MKITKALVLLKMARSGAEATRLVKQGSVWFGGCIAPCNARMAPFKCTCNGWKKTTNPTEEVSVGTVLRIKDGSWRLLTREDGKQGFDEVAGIGRIPDPPSAVIPNMNLKGSFVEELQLNFWRTIFAVRNYFTKEK